MTSPVPTVPSLGKMGRYSQVLVQRLAHHYQKQAGLWYVSRELTAQPNLEMGTWRLALPVKGSEDMAPTASRITNRVTPAVISPPHT